jgi:hypothetical protein
VNTPFAKLALPTRPTAPMSKSNQPDGILGFGAGVTDSVIVVELVNMPEVPVMVTLAVPTVAVLVAVNVNVLVLVALAGLKEAVTPLGRPDADKLTLPLKPFCGVTVIVLVPMVPCTTLTLAGDAERE